MIHGIELKPLKIFPDDRGFFMETLRQDDPFFRGFGQSAVTVSYPGGGLSRTVSINAAGAVDPQ